MTDTKLEGSRCGTEDEVRHASTSTSTSVAVDDSLGQMETNNLNKQKVGGVRNVIT